MSNFSGTGEEMTPKERAEKIWVACNKAFLVNHLAGKVEVTMETFIAAEIAAARDEGYAAGVADKESAICEAVAEAVENIMESDGMVAFIKEREREAVEEARHCCFAEDSPCNQKALAVGTIKAEAYENAAKILTAEAVRLRSIADEEIGLEGVRCIEEAERLEQLAATIRARKEEILSTFGPDPEGPNEVCK